MTDKIILNINHSDDYTDYLFMTAGLTDKRILPMLNPSGEKLRAVRDPNTLVLRCYNSRKELSPWDNPVVADIAAGSIRVLSRFFLADDGTINPGNAEIVRQTIQEALMNVLYSPENLREAFRQYFPLLWRNRQKIYADPRLFFAGSGHYGSSIFSTYSDDMPIGAMLKAMEEEPRTFRIRLGGGCSCGERPLLVEYERVYGEHWTLHTWCPACGSRREIRAWNFQRTDNIERAVDDARAIYDKGQGRSALSLFDVVDELRSA